MMPPQKPLRRPFFPISDYAHIADGFCKELEMLPKPPEGHISPDQAEFLFHLVRLIQPMFVVETGFGVGHSACVIMHAQMSIGLEPHLMSIDSCQYSQTLPASHLLAARYPRFSLVQGDSKDILMSSVNSHIRENEGLTLDLGIIDGGHDAETALHDLEVLSSFLVVGGYLWLDDFDKIVPCAGVNMAGRKFARRWGNCQKFRTSDNRGFMLYQKTF